ncbi:MAG: hypothetical protein E7079_05330 [Bacteroidales bacterium]|nr:hypothetical protein [Bacteroidales bacterium]
MNPSHLCQDFVQINKSAPLSGVREVKCLAFEVVTYFNPYHVPKRATGVQCICGRSFLQRTELVDYLVVVIGKSALPKSGQMDSEVGIWG